MDQNAIQALWPQVQANVGKHTKHQLEALSDLELIANINEGDEAAFEVLYHRHKDWVVNLAYRWTGSRDLALDILQEAFFYFSKKFPGFRLTAKLQTFFYPVVRNLSIASRRKSERYQSNEEEQQSMEQSAIPAHVTDEGEQLQWVLRMLPEEQREVLLLRFVDELSLAEISEAMEIPLGTVKSRLHNALETLRQDVRTKKMFEE
ncbi:RNA polymerase sigma factor [Pedosphaera parvula]|uniref:RNA polymerase, sigma-24 subunit, ECF subfamily n=1 Tax=Pedosphaera parvula (strain Ellin514) TaxID=320771 RepID=B9XLF1_PEDPL|nr:RNA polymerase sigma factor [Pedosphaera parvula]EEF59354.1 RNA polymerase, sigma-24 subunit, ECF subfamily [Pedosphaera parvula Ellin514]